MNRGERSRVTKAAQRRAQFAERRTVRQLIENHKAMLSRMLPQGEKRDAVLTFADEIIRQIDWAWHREDLT